MYDIHTDAIWLRGWRRKFLTLPENYEMLFCQKKIHFSLWMAFNVSVVLSVCRSEARE